MKTWMVSVLVLSAWPLTSVADLTREQQNFLDARAAWEARDMARYESLAYSLRGYELYPYLEFDEVRANPGDTARVDAFVSRYEGSVLASRMRGIQLTYLGRSGAWREFGQRWNDSDDTAMNCYRLTGEAMTQGVSAKWKQDAREVWLYGGSLPEACDPVFARMESDGMLGSDLVLQRIALAFEKSNLSLAGYLAKKLPASQQGWYTLWLEMHKNPSTTLDRTLSMRSSGPLLDIIVHGVTRMAKDDTPAAWRYWRTALRPVFTFNERQLAKVENAIALRAGWRHLPEAGSIFADIPDSSLDEEGKEWRVRSALRDQDWVAALRYIDHLSAEDQKDNQWKYWKARGLQQTGKRAEAGTLFAELAAGTGYYNFLAAEIMKTPYAFNSVPVVHKGDEGKVDKLEQQPSMRRARELRLLGLDIEAMREWNHTLGNMPVNERLLAARLAQRWQWHFAAILSAGRADHLEDLDLRFPLVYRSEVVRGARQQGLPESWVYGVVRRESAFRPEAVSPAGARGLMQLMPGTARNVAKNLGIKVRNQDLNNPDTNIALGSAYLRQVSDQYNGNEALATASYNAGPHRVKQWLPDQGLLPADVWVDTITFDETRDYVKAVMFYSTVFDWKLNKGQPRLLSQRMRPVLPLASMQVSASNP